MYSTKVIGRYSEPASAANIHYESYHRMDSLLLELATIFIGYCGNLEKLLRKEWFYNSNVR